MSFQSFNANKWEKAFQERYHHPLEWMKLRIKYGEDLIAGVFQTIPEESIADAMDQKLEIHMEFERVWKIEYPFQKKK